MKKCITIAIIGMLGLLYAHCAVASASVNDVLKDETGLLADRARIKKIFLAPDSVRAVIILEDAHCNLPVQEKLVLMITAINGSLKSAGAIDTPVVLQEGGKYGAVNTALLTQGSTAEETRVFLDDALKNGTIGAAEYLHARDGGFFFAGIEDESLYDENYRYFMDVALRNADIDAFVSDVWQKLERIQNMVFLPELKEYYAATKVHAQGKGELTRYLDFLYHRAMQYSIDLSKFPTLSDYFDLIDTVEHIDHDALEHDFAGFVKNSGVQIKNIEEITRYVESGELSVSEYPVLYKFARARLLLDAVVENLDFIKEKEALESEIFTKLAYTDEEKKLVHVLRDFHISSKILGFQLTRSEYEYYAQQVAAEKNLLSDTVRFIQSYYPEYKPPFSLEALQKSAESFYAVVNMRDEALCTNIVRMMEERQADIVTVILGGFHSEGVTRRLKERNVSYIVLSPEIKQVDSQAPLKYYDIMQRYWFAK